MKKLFVMVILVTSVFSLCAQDIGHPLVKAVREGNYAEASRLLSQGTNVNAQDQFASALHYAALNNDTRLIDLLLRYGANINLQDRSLKTPLHYAAGRNNRNAAELLLSREANPEITDIQGRRPIDYPMIQQIFEELRRVRVIREKKQFTL